MRTLRIEENSHLVAEVARLWNAPGLLALRIQAGEKSGRSARCVVLGTGFCCPPADSPFPDWRPWLKNDPRQLRRDEQQLLDNINRVLHVSGRPALEQVSQLYGQADDTLLATYPELDPFGPRRESDYYGVPPKWSSRNSVK